QPTLPGRLAGEEQRAEALGHVGEPPGLRPVRILERDERQAAAVAIQERLAVGEVGVAEVERADRREAAALQRVIEQNADELLVLAELPDQAPAARLQGFEPPGAELGPGDDARLGQRRANVGT